MIKCSYIRNIILDLYCVWYGGRCGPCVRSPQLHLDELRKYTISCQYNLHKIIPSYIRLQIRSMKTKLIYLIIFISSSISSLLYMIDCYIDTLPFAQFKGLCLVLQPRRIVINRCLTRICHDYWKHSLAFWAALTSGGGVIWQRNLTL
jgi:hypothetical protein